MKYTNFPQDLIKSMQSKAKNKTIPYRWIGCSASVARPMFTNVKQEIMPINTLKRILFNSLELTFMCNRQ
jgi:hypothetical protein